MRPHCRVAFLPGSPGCACLTPVLRAGVGVAIPCALSVRTLLCDILGLSPEFVELRVATIFHNNSPVDDIDTVIAAPGDSLALAAAMPGVAGITMRRNSPIKALRADISCASTVTPGQHQAGDVTLKLFNFIALEAGPGLLARGVAAPAPILAQTLRDNVRHLASLDLDGRPATPDDLDRRPGNVTLVASEE